MRPMATRISLKAILLAALADIACTYGYGLKVSPTPTWYTVAAYGAVIPAAIMGGHLGVLRKQTLAAVRSAWAVKAAG
jgi:hypothetical protein